MKQEATQQRRKPRSTSKDSLRKDPPAALLGGACLPVGIYLAVTSSLCEESEIPLSFTTAQLRKRASLTVGIAAVAVGVLSVAYSSNGTTAPTTTTTTNDDHDDQLGGEQRRRPS